MVVGRLVGLVEVQLAVAGAGHVWVLVLIRPVFLLAVVLDLVLGV